LTGTGTDSPKGVLTGLTTSARIQTNTIAVTAIGDIYALKQALAPTRFFAKAVLAAHPTVWDIVYRFTGGNSAEPLLLADRGGDCIGVPKFEWSTMSTATTTTGSKIMIIGQWDQFVIADRIGATIEILPHLLGATNRFPIGARGAYFYWRTGSTVLASATPNAGFKYLEVK